MESKLLFDDLQVKSLTIEEASSALGVSAASVRNWIKTGYLKKTGRNLIDWESFERFALEIAGTEKLTTRANKSMLDSHDHDALSRAIHDRLKSRQVGDLGELGEEYAATLSNAYRNREGVYYTPAAIAASFFDCLPPDLTGLTFMDPCCGSGTFLIAAIEAGFEPRNVYGFDVDPIAAAIATERLGALDSAAAGNVVCSDFLELFLRRRIEEQVDVIFTNPPWGKRIDKNFKERLCSYFDSPKSIDSSALFFLASEQLTADDGYLGMLLPDAFFSVGSFRKARERALEHHILQMKDHGKVFRALMTNARSLTIRKRCPDPDVKATCAVGGTTYFRSQESFRQNPKSIFNIGCTPDEAEVISGVLDRPHITLRGHARWGLGIVTGSNKRLVKDHPEAGHIPVFRGSDIHKDHLDGPACFLPRDLSLYQQVAPTELFEAPEKLVYRFICSRLVFYLDAEQRYFLNSANMIVPDSDFPVRPGLLTEYLNSRFVNWLFRKLFATHKVLRTDLERIPIFPEILQEHEKFNEERFLKCLGLIEVAEGTYRLKKSDPLNT